MSTPVANQAIYQRRNGKVVEKRSGVPQVLVQTKEYARSKISLEVHPWKLLLKRVTMQINRKLWCDPYFEAELAFYFAVKFLPFYRSWGFLLPGLPRPVPTTNLHQVPLGERTLQDRYAQLDNLLFLKFFYKQKFRLISKYIVTSVYVLSLLSLRVAVLLCWMLLWYGKILREFDLP